MFGAPGLELNVNSTDYKVWLILFATFEQLNVMGFGWFFFGNFLLLIYT